LADVVWRWKPESYQRRPQLVEAVWRGLFLMMVFSATVVFETGVARWLGLMLSSTFTFLGGPPSCEKSSRAAKQ
jgi:hypothetical protein